MEQTHTGTVEVLYIAPLKSLINDQFERIDTLLSDSGIPVFIGTEMLPPLIKTS